MLFKKNILLCSFVSLSFCVCVCAFFKQLELFNDVYGSFKILYPEVIEVINIAKQLHRIGRF